MIVMLAGVQGSDPWSLLVESGTTLLSTIESLFILVFALIFRTDLSESRKILGFDLRRRTVLSTDRVVDFLAMHADLFGGVDPDSNLVPSNIDDGDFNVVADHDRFIALPGQHQHGGSFLGKGSEKFRSAHAWQHPCRQCAHPGYLILVPRARPWCESSASPIDCTVKPGSQNGLCRLGQRNFRLKPQQRLAGGPF